MKRLDVIAMVAFGLMLVGSTAQVQAQTKYFCADTDNTWSGSSGQNWRTFAGDEDCDDGTRVDAPTAADRAVIVSGKTCNVDVTTAVADSLDVESTGTLNIQAGKKLTIDDTAASNTTIAGTLNITASGANIGELAFITNNQTIDGAGAIVGQHNAAKISIESDITLTNDTTIEGHLKVTGDGDFVNTGTVHANTGGALLIDCNSFDDESGALWKISTSISAILRFNVTSGSSVTLDGDFEIDDGTLDVDSIGFQTNGSLDWTGGTIGVSQASAITFG